MAYFKRKKSGFSGLVLLLSGIIGGNFFIVKIPRLAVILVRELYDKRAVLFTAYYSFGVYSNATFIFALFLCRWS